ncbi:MAG: hypothetical protein J6M03_04550 [Clostridia bacterium]|nr:hypothetical protein [Clostridia bacterium]
MTNKDILKAFSGLDADTVIACAPGGAPQRKNRLVLRVVAIAACLALLVSAVVVSTLLLNREDENQPDVPSDVTGPSNEKKKYEMYMSFSAGENSDMNISANENVEFKPAEQKEFNLFSSENKIDIPESVPNSINLKVGEKSYSLNCHSAVTTAIDKSQKFKALGTIVKYRNEEATVEITAATEEIALFLDYEVPRNIDGDFSVDEAKQAAEKLFAQLYGEGFSNDYEYDKSATTNDESEKTHYLYYKRTVWGFETDDYIMIRYNFNGELISLNAYGKGIMEFAEEDLTKEDIEDAVAAVTETFSDTWYIGNSKITLDSEGDYYLMTYLVHADGDKITELRKVYTKIK